MLDPKLQLASPKDMDIPVCLATADEAIAAIQKEHAAWTSRQSKSAGRG